MLILLKKARSNTISEDNRDLLEEVFKNRIFVIRHCSLAATIEYLKGRNYREFWPHYRN